MGIDVEEQRQGPHEELGVVLPEHRTEDGARRVEVGVGDLPPRLGVRPEVLGQRVIGCIGRCSRPPWPRAAGRSAPSPPGWPGASVVDISSPPPRPALCARARPGPTSGAEPGRVLGPCLAGSSVRTRDRGGLRVGPPVGRPLRSSFSMGSPGWSVHSPCDLLARQVVDGHAVEGLGREVALDPLGDLSGRRARAARAGTAAPRR